MVLWAHYFLSFTNLVNIRYLKKISSDNGLTTGKLLEWLTEKARLRNLHWLMSCSTTVFTTRKQMHYSLPFHCLGMLKQCAFPCDLLTDHTVVDCLLLAGKYSVSSTDTAVAACQITHMPTYVRQQLRSSGSYCQALLPYSSTHYRFLLKADLPPDKAN